MIDDRGCGDLEVHRAESGFVASEFVELVSHSLVKGRDSEFPEEVKQACQLSVRRYLRLGEASFAMAETQPRIF